MKSMSRLLLSLAAVAACTTVNAAPFDSADQARRDRNREEVMAKNGLSSTAQRSDTTHRVEEKKTVKSETNKAVASGDAGCLVLRRRPSQSSTTQAGAWSLGFSRPRTARSTPACERRFLAGALSSR